MFSRNNHNFGVYVGRGDVNKNMGRLGTEDVCRSGGVTLRVGVVETRRKLDIL